jgi:hypothetical protein
MFQELIIDREIERRHIDKQRLRKNKGKEGKTDTKFSRNIHINKERERMREKR